MSVQTIVLYGASCIVGGCIQSIAGFGFSIFVMSVFPFFMPNYLMSLVLNGTSSMPINAVIAWKSKGKPAFQLLFIPLAASLLSFQLATEFLLPRLTNIMTLLLGLFLIASSVFSLFLSGKVQIKPNWITGIIVGTLYGIFAALFSMGGPVMAIYLLAIFTDLPSYYCNLNLFFFLTSISTNLTRIFNGMFQPSWIVYAIIGAACGIIGILIGQRIQKHISQSVLKKGIYIYVAISGIFMILRTFL